MKKLFIKADRFILDKLTQYVKYWITKHDGEKHKIDFLILIEKYNFYALILLAMLIPTLILIIERQFLAAGIQSFIWIFLGGFGYFHKKHSNDHLKQYYDVVYALRKEPAFCNAYKEALDSLFIEGRKIRISFTLFMFCFDFSIAGLLILLAWVSNFQNPSHIVGIYLMINGFVTIIDRYILLVFDMDEPMQKEEAKESITDIVRREWEQLIGGLSPTPVFIKQ